MKTDKIVPTFCALPMVAFESQDLMERCVLVVLANASSVQDPDSSKKVGGGEVGVVKNDDGVPNFNTTSLADAWNSAYMRNVRKMMLRGEKPHLV